MSFFTVAEVKEIDKPRFIPVIVECSRMPHIKQPSITVLQCGHDVHRTEKEARKCLDLAFSYPLVQEKMRKGEPYLEGKDWIPNSWILRGKGPPCPYKTCTHSYGKRMDIHRYPPHMNTPEYYWCISCGYDSREEEKLREKDLLK